MFYFDARENWLGQYSPAIVLRTARPIADGSATSQVIHSFSTESLPITAGLEPH
jgi:hypothetical protein